MAFQAWNVLSPHPIHWDSVTAITPGQVTLNPTKYPVATIVEIPKTGTLETVEFYVDTVTSGQDIDVQFRAVNETTGDPETTVDQYRTVTPVATTWTIPGDMTSDGTDSGIKRTVTRGDKLCVVWTWTGSTGTAVDIQQNDFTATFARNRPPLPAGRNANFGAAMTLREDGGDMCIALKYTDGTYAEMYGTWPRSTSSTVTIGSGSTPDEVGFKIKFRYAVQTNGMWFHSTASGDFSLQGYDINDTALFTPPLTHNGDWSDTSSASEDHWFFTFPSTVSLAQDAWYRFTVKPTTATTLALPEITLANALHQAAWGSPECIWTERTDAGVWTDTDTRRFIGGLQLTALSDGL